MVVYGACALLSLLPAMTRADHMIQGRTGLPVVRQGQGQIWMHQGHVELKPMGGDLVVTQDYTLQLPGPPLKAVPVQSQIAVREDYFRSRDGHMPSVTGVEAQGFKDFDVFVDGQRVDVATDPWHINEKGDTATRWRVWNVDFAPGEEHKMQIVSRAPLGEQNGRPLIEFVSKDVGHWRESPDHLVIRYIPAEETGTVAVAALAPKPGTHDEQQVEWTYHKGSPGRDIYILLPARRHNESAQ
jgi:hypothetical protein